MNTKKEKHEPYLREVNITPQELALWWIENIIRLLFFGSVGFIAGLYIASLTGSKPLCAPASLNGKTVTNCIQK